MDYSDFIEYYRIGSSLKKSKLGSIQYKIKRKTLKNELSAIGLEYGFTGNRKALKKSLENLLLSRKISGEELYRILQEIEEIPLFLEIAEQYPQYIGTETIRKARDALFSRGWVKWEKKASSMLGEESFYSIYEGSIMGVYVEEGEAKLVLYNGKNYSIIIPDKNSEGLSYDALIQILRPRLIVSYGLSRNDRIYEKTLDYKLLAKLAIPQLQTGRLDYVLAVLYGSEPTSIEDKLKMFLDSAIWMIERIMERLPEIGRIELPKGLKGLSSPPIKAGRPPSSRRLEQISLPHGKFASNEPTDTYTRDTVLVTENIHPMHPVFSPYAVILPDASGGTPESNYARLLVYMAARSLGWWYDPLLLLKGLEEYPRIKEGVENLVREKLIYKKTCKAPPTRLQVKPWDLDRLVKLCGKKINGRRLIVDTLSNPAFVLLGGNGVTPEETTLVPRRLLANKTKHCISKIESHGQVHCIDEDFPRKLSEVFPRIEVITNESVLPRPLRDEFKQLSKTKEKPKVKIYGLASYITGFHELATALSSIATPGTVVIVPNKPLKNLVSLLHRSGVKPLTLSELVRNPHTIQGASRIVIVRPEKTLAHQLPPFLYSTSDYKEAFAGLLGSIVSWIRRLAVGSEIVLLSMLSHEFLEHNLKIETLAAKGEPYVLSLEEMKNLHLDLLERARDIFEEHWSSKRKLSLRGYQEKAIAYALSMYTFGTPSVVVTVLPTGAGKSAIYQVLGRLLGESLVGLPSIVVSPLRTLIHDQVRSLRNKGFMAEYIDAGISSKRRREILELYKNGLLDFLYITPERFEDPIVQEMIMPPKRPLFIVLDEVHTLSKWGRSFRPSYLHMARVLLERNKAKPKIPILGFTATLPPGVDTDVVKILTGLNTDPLTIKVDLKDSYRKLEELGWHQSRPLVIKGPVIRRELKFDVEPVSTVEERREKLVSLLKTLTDRYESRRTPYIGIVFTGFVESEESQWANVDTVVDLINKSMGKDIAIGYHGSLSDSERLSVERKIYESSETGNPPKIVVATKAFGMGVDIPNIRFVIHYMLSESIEDYYQEAGRAGRDGRTSYIVSLYSGKDKDLRRRLLEIEEIQPSSILRTYNLIVELHNWLKSRSKNIEVDPYTIVLPSEAFIPVTPVKARGDRSAPLRAAQKILDILAEHEILTYETFTANLPTVKASYNDVERFADTIYPLIPGVYLVDGRLPKDVSSVKVEYSIGRIEEKTKTIPLSIECCGKQVYKSESFKGAYRKSVISGRKNYVVIRLNPDARLEKHSVLPYTILNYLYRREEEDHERIEYLDQMLSEAVKAKNQGKNPDRIIKNRITEYFTSEPRKEPEEDLFKTGSIKTCDRMEQCILPAANDLSMLLYSTGYNARRVVLAVSKKEVSDKILGLLSRSGVKKEPTVTRYSNLRRGYSRRGELYLMDKGYIVMVLGADKYSEVEEMVRSYPYLYAYLYRV